MTTHLPTVTLYLPGMQLVNAANAREHHMVRARRAKAQRAAAYLRLMSLSHARAFGVRPATPRRPRSIAWPMPCVVTIVRIGPRLLDDDNLAVSAKAVRDGLADAFGVDDGPAGGVSWRYEQRKGRQATRNPPRRAEYGVEVRIEAAPAAERHAHG